MTKEYHCDICDSRIDNGYTVAWCSGTGENPSYIHFGGNVTKNVCSDCWPKDSFTDKLKTMLGLQ